MRQTQQKHIRKVQLLDIVLTIDLRISCIESDYTSAIMKWQRGYLLKLFFSSAFIYLTRAPFFAKELAADRKNGKMSFHLDRGVEQPGSSSGS